MPTVLQLQMMSVKEFEDFMNSFRIGNVKIVNSFYGVVVNYFHCVYNGGVCVQC